MGLRSLFSALVHRMRGRGVLGSWAPSYGYTSTPVCMVIFHSSPTFEYTLHTLPFQDISSPSRSRHKVSMSTTANAPSPCSETSTFLVSLMFRTSSYVSKSSCHPLSHL